jgi:hypothetical protein
LNAKTYAERKGFARQTIATPFEVITVKLDGLATLINTGRPKKAYTSFKAQFLLIKGYGKEYQCKK